jgi:hypothetical protein
MKIAGDHLIYENYSESLNKICTKTFEIFYRQVMSTNIIKVP